MDDTNSLIEQRKAKLAALKAKGIDPFKNKFTPTETCRQARENYGEGREVALAGRITAHREMGKSMFVDIRDQSGRIQIYAQKNALEEHAPGSWDIFTHLDLADFIGVKGTLFTTKTGEISVKLASFTILAKALRPPPAKWHGLEDTEIRYRQRYLDLMANPDVKDIFLKRSEIIREIRNFLHGRGFVEMCIRDRLMDEPTTHLDMASIDALVYALEQFKGTLIFISHDVYFIRALSTHVVHVNAGRLTHYPGGYQYYLDKTKASSARAALTSGGTNGGASSASPNNSGRRVTPLTENGLNRKEQKRIEAQQRQARSGERKAQQQLVHKLEKEIQELEAKQVELTAELEKPETYEKLGRAQEINRELSHVQERLAAATPEWEAAADILAKAE